MSSYKNPVEEFEFHAYVDGELDEQRREVVEEWLENHPQDAQRVEEYRRQNQSMHSLFDPVLSEPVPDVLNTNNDQSAASASLTGYPMPLLRVAAMLGFMLFGGVIGYGVHDLTSDEGVLPVMVSLPRQAAIAHVVYTPEVLHPVEVTADQEAHLAKWLSKRLGTELRVPHLSLLGYHLVGGRLLPGEAGAAAQFMYENSQGKRLTLYVKSVREKVSETAFRYDQQDGVSVFYWVDGPLGYALSGEIDKQGLLDAANEVYRMINI